jgi:hypothetical protein
MKGMVRWAKVFSEASLDICIYIIKQHTKNICMEGTTDFHNPQG